MVSLIDSLRIIPSLFPISVYCRNENWESEYQAQPFDKDEEEKLETKRKRRRQCTCGDVDNPGRNLNEDR